MFYLFNHTSTYDIYTLSLHDALPISENGEENLLTQTNFKHLYWNMSQQLAHHTITGCPVFSGDLMGSGTISGPEENGLGCLLEITRNGKEPVKLKDNLERRFLEDHDTISMRAFCEKENLKLGFGELTTKLLPVLKAEKK